MADIPIVDQVVESAFTNYSPLIQQKLEWIRQLVFETAQASPVIRELEETLKWGQPSYLTSKTKSGTILRIDQVRSSDSQFAVYFSCQTTLMNTFKTIYPDEFNYEGQRAIVFDIEDDINVDALQDCINLILTYHHCKNNTTKPAQAAQSQSRTA